MRWWMETLKVKALLLLALLACALALPPPLTGAAGPAALLGPPRQDEITPDPVIAAMLAGVSESVLRGYAGGLSGEWPVTVGGQPYTLATRYSYHAEAMEKATQFVYEHFEGLGLETEYHEFEMLNGTELRNVIAEQPGVLEPGCIYILSAHLDSTSETPSQRAPGADDNASGSSAVLAAADLLSRHTFGCTLRYALFTGEEQGLHGSKAYAAGARALGEDIRGVVNLDMVGFNSSERPEPVIELHTRDNDPGDLRLASTFTEVVEAYELDLVPQVLQDGPWYSDHAAFWGEDYPAIIGIEDHTRPDEDTTPDYHRTTDRIDTLDFTYLANYARAALGTLAHLGELVPGGALEGAVTAAGEGLPLEGATVSASPGSGLVYTTTSGTDGSYLLSLPAGQYSVRFEEPWHAPQTAGGISISGQLTTTLNASLQHLPVFEVSGSVLSAATLAPLSATVSVLDFPLPPVQTDAATGEFSLRLPQGERRLNAAAPGHFPRQFQLLLEADSRLEVRLFQRLDLYLPLLELLSAAPGSRFLCYHRMAFSTFNGVIPGQNCHF